MCFPSKQASPWFPCPKCGYPIDSSEGSKHYIGTSNPNMKGETYRYYKCPECATVIKRKTS